MSGRNFIGGSQLEKIRLENPSLYNFCRRVVTAINTLGQNGGISPTGASDPPPSIGAVNVKSSGETVHVTLDDPSPVSNQIEYFVEAATDANFSAPHVFHLKAGRGAFLNLPAKDDNGTAQPWHFRGYSQYPGSQPSAPVYFGGLSPQPVTLTGSTQLTPLQSTGSGTGTTLGQQGGWGRGKVPVRSTPGPRRTTA